jgi:hypothetical protein
MSRQSDEDVLLFKSFDSGEGSVKCKWPSTIYPIPSSDLADKKRKKEREHGPTKILNLLDVPHTSFSLPETLNGVRSRESIEVRALVFLYPTI